MRSIAQGGSVTATANVVGIRGPRHAGATLCVVAVVSAFAVLVARSSPAAPDARVFAAQALALRAAGISGAMQAGEVLSDIPAATASDDRESLLAVWSPFFENAIVKLGRLESRAPAALYYNPLLDVALFTLWTSGDGGYRVASIRAVPGERLADPDAGVELRPRWTAEGDGPVAALRHLAAERLRSFARAHPAHAREDGRDDRTFAVAAADMRDVQPRLLWNTAMRMHWTGERSQWLGPVLERIDAALGTRDAPAIRAAAPDTDAATADALSSLPPEFAAALVLDMTLAADGDHQLIIASAPADGHVYVLALCRLEGEMCTLRRLFLTSIDE